MNHGDRLKGLRLYWQSRQPKASLQVLKQNGFSCNSKNIDMNCRRDLGPKGDQVCVKLRFLSYAFSIDCNQKAYKSTREGASTSSPNLGPFFFKQSTTNWIRTLSWWRGAERGAGRLQFTGFPEGSPKQRVKTSSPPDPHPLRLLLEATGPWICASFRRPTAFLTCKSKMSHRHYKNIKKSKKHIFPLYLFILFFPVILFHLLLDT